MKTLTVPGELPSLPEIGNFVMAAAADAGLDRKQGYRLRLAVDEIATNIINYGYARHERVGQVVVSAEVVGDTLTVVLEDTAPPFDPLDHPLPTEEELDDALEDRPIGGLGIFLAIENVDEFRYEPVEGGNRNVFVVKLDKPAAGS